jgi:hypothetical protein
VTTIKWFLELLRLIGDIDKPLGSATQILYTHICNVYGSEWVGSAMYD